MANYLFPYKYKKIGYVIFLIGVFLYIIPQLSDFTFKINIHYFRILGGFSNEIGSVCKWAYEDILNEIIIILVFIGCVLSLFSKEIIEDEFITKIRLESLVLGIYLNILLLIIITLTVFDLFYLTFIMYSVFTYLIFAFIIFHYKLYQYKKMEINNEE